MADKPLKIREMPLDGKLNTAVDPIMVGGNFQELKNLRYTDTNPQSIKGMTKINSSAISSYPKISNGFHFKKEQPAESYVLVQAHNYTETDSRIYQNTTAIPDTGSFAQYATSQVPETIDGTGQGRFSEAPNGNVAYCNGDGAFIWGGLKHYISGFVNYHPDGNFSKDFTTVVQNTLTDAANIAVLTPTPNTLDALTVLLMHFENDVVDAIGTHTPVNNNVTFTTLKLQLGTYVASFNGSNSYITIPDHADFDFGDGAWSLDMWVEPNDSVGGTIFSQATDASNYIRLQHTNATGYVFEVVAAGSTVVPLNFHPLFFGELAHIEITEWLNEWYFFVDGMLVDHTTDADRAADYTGEFYIGCFYDGAARSHYFQGYIDEFRVGQTPFHVAPFDPRAVPYGTTATYLLIGAVRPLAGIYFDVAAPNTIAGDTKVQRWEYNEYGVPMKPAEPTTPLNSKWTFINSIDDDTEVGGKPLAQDGLIRFDDYSSRTEAPKIENNSQFYWYRIIFTNLEDTTSIANATLLMPMQRIKDLWDGDVRTSAFFEVDTGTNKFDNTVNINEPTYTETNSATYSNLSALPANGELLVGFVDRMCALDIKFVAGYANDTKDNATRVYSWSWGGWEEVWKEKEGTYAYQCPFNKSGIISWRVPENSRETAQEIGGRPPLFYYKIEFDKVISADCRIYFIGGIPVQKQIDGYKFPLLSHNRLMLGSSQADKKNMLLVGAIGSGSVFNGTESRELIFGNDDELVAGSEIYGQFDSNIYNLTLICKKSESWLMSEEESNFTWYKVSPTIGCTAPLTMTSIHLPALDERPAMNGAIFQSTDAIYFFDGSEFHPLHRDIEDIFTRIKKPYLDKSVGFLDETNQEWHWLVTTGDLDENTMLLLHYDNDYLDGSPLSPHTITNQGTTFDATYKKFGSHSCKFVRGSNQYMTIPDSPEFNLNGGNWTIDFQIYVENSFTGGSRSIYYQSTDALNFIELKLTESGSNELSVQLWQLGGDDYSFSSGNGFITFDNWHHVAFVQDQNDFYVFIDGQLANSDTDSTRFPDYTGLVYIGASAGAGNFMDGYIDELRVSNTSRWTSPFTSPSAAHDPGTIAHNEEWVLDLKREKWFQVDRTVYLQAGFKVEDTIGNFYTYGAIDTGYVERLENGTDFDGNDIVSSFQTGDIAVSGSTMIESQVRHIHLLAKAKNITVNSIILTHYGEGATAGTTLTPISPANSSGRIISKVKSENTGKHVFHSLKASMTTDDETIGFEPLALGVFYQDAREHKGIKNN